MNNTVNMHDLTIKWRNIFKENSISEEDCVIIASEDLTKMKIVSLYLQYLRQKNIYLIYVNDEVRKLVEETTGVDVHFIKTERDNIESLRIFPSTHYVFDNIFRCEFDGEDIDGYKLVGVKGITLEDVIIYGILRLGNKARQIKDKQDDSKNNLVTVKKDCIQKESRKCSVEYYKKFDLLEEEIERISAIGERKYQEYFTDEKRTYFITPLPGTGDIYLLSIYIHEYCKRKKIDDYILYVTNNNLNHVANVMGITAEVMPKEDMKCVYTWRRANVISDDNVFVLDQNMYQKQNNYLQAIPELDYNTMISRLIFDGTEIDKQGRIQLKAEKLISDELNILAEKNVLLAPYANTIGKIDWNFWNDLAEEFKRFGIRVFVNVSDKEKNMINGTESVFIPYEKVSNFANRCLAVIGVRSGLFDILSSLNCKLVIIYSGKMYNSETDNINFFGLKNMGLRDHDILEMIYDENINDKEIIKRKIVGFSLGGLENG